MTPKGRLRWSLFIWVRHVAGYFGGFFQVAITRAEDFGRVEIGLRVGLAENPGLIANTLAGGERPTKKL